MLSWNTWFAALAPGVAVTALVAACGGRRRLIHLQPYTEARAVIRRRGAEA